MPLIDRRCRRGATYLAVLGTSLIVTVLALAALLVQRIQNRTLVSASQMHQAQLNALAAVQIGTQMVADDLDWRATLGAGTWFTDRDTGVGTCSLEVVDRVDGNVSDSTADPITLVGIGKRGTAVQRVEVTLEPYDMPLTCLNVALAANLQIVLNGDTLRADNTITAQRIEGQSGSNVYGPVDAMQVVGGTYHDVTTTIDAEDLVTMPDFNTVCNLYVAEGNEIRYSDLPTTTPNLADNSGIEAGTAPWTGTPPGEPAATAQASAELPHTGTNSLKITARTDHLAGAAQAIDHIIKPGQSYTISAWIHQLGFDAEYQLNLITNSTGGGRQVTTGGVTLVPQDTWTQVSATLAAPVWSGDLESAFLMINTTGDQLDFYVDDVVVQDLFAGRQIYRELLSPNHNPFGGGQTNASGVYWIDCGGADIRIERSRIVGTLVLLDPGGNSQVGAGPISWTAAKTGYPALLTNEDFAIRATARGLSEAEHSTNFNPAGAPHDELGTDADQDDIYPSEIAGLVGVGGELTYANRPVVRGTLLVGGDIRDSSGILEVEYDDASLVHPPPGFTGTTRYRLMTGTARRTVE